MTFGQQNTEAEGHEQMSIAAEYGVNFFDTAELYPISPLPETQGRTSEIVGTWLQGHRREDFIIATKVTGRSGNMPWIPANRTIPRGKETATRVNRASIRAALEGELRRLQVDYVDLMQIHWPDRYSTIFGSNQYKVSSARTLAASRATAPFDVRRPWRAVVLRACSVSRTHAKPDLQYGHVIPGTFLTCVLDQTQPRCSKEVVASEPTRLGAACVHPEGPVDGPT